MSVLYDNGSVDVFNNNQNASVNTPNDKATQNLELSSDCAEMAKSISFYNGYPVKNPSRVPLGRSQVRDFMDCYDEKIANRFYHFSRMRGTGVTLTVLGLIATGGGIGLAVSADDGGYYSSDDDWKIGAGVGIASLGTAMWCVGIPLAAVGGGGKRRQLRKFNEMYIENKYSYDDSLSNQLMISLNAKKNGVGFVLTF